MEKGMKSISAINPVISKNTKHLIFEMPLSENTLIPGLDLEGALN